MMLQIVLPTVFWWDAYQTSNNFKNRLPTKTMQNYITLFKAQTKYRPELSHLRLWGCEAYVKLPRNDTRKDLVTKH